MTTLTKTQERELNKKINFLLSHPIHTSDFSNPLYTVTDYRYYNMNEFEQGFKNHEEAQKYMEENVERNTPTEMTYKDDSGFGRGKYKYIIKEWHPTVYTFKTKGQAYWFLRNNPEIIDSDLIEF